MGTSGFGFRLGFGFGFKEGLGPTSGFSAADLLCLFSMNSVMSSFFMSCLLMLLWWLPC
jgi:hypothetical protein